MVALWIVLAVLVVAAVVTAVTFVPRRRARRAERAGDEDRQASQPSQPSHQHPAPEKTTASTTAVATREPADDTTLDATAVADPVTGEAAAEPTVGSQEATVGAITTPPALRDRMGKTRGLLSGYVRALRAKGSVDEQTWEELEEALLRADIGVATTTSLLDDLRARLRRGELRGPDAVVEALRGELRAALRPNGSDATATDATTDATTDVTTDVVTDVVIDVWLFVGVNGVGKTTTIGKVARRQLAGGRSVVLAAGDTFRAAAAEQLATWAERTGVPVVRGAEGGDPSAVVYDAVRSAAARGDDLVLADTAGRLHTKVNLIEELKKIRRVADRPPGRVTEVLLVLDATTGQNGLAQARQFTEAVGVTGVVLTKLDGTAKGGIVVAIQRELGLPVKLVGIGEGVDDLVPFDPDEFVDALFE